MAQALTLSDIERLGELLASLPEPFLPMDADMLDGYLTAIALLKHPPQLQDWLGFVFDVNGNPRAKLPNAQQQAQLRKLILARGAEIEARILSEQPIDPIIYDDDGNEPTDDVYAALYPFVDGFSFACMRWPELMKSSSKAVQAALVGIMRYEPADDAEQDSTDTELSAMLEQLDAEMHFSLDEALADIAACVQEIAEVTRADDIAGSEQRKPRQRRASRAR